jgi:hypothetical protein
MNQCCCSVRQLKNCVIKITERNTSRTGLTQPFCMTLQAQ